MGKHMNDAQKTKSQLISELNELRRQVAVTKESERLSEKGKIGMRRPF